jgi:hypothetical protein
VLEERSKSKKQRFRRCVVVLGNLLISWWHLPSWLAIVPVETALDKGRETSPTVIWWRAAYGDGPNQYVLPCAPTLP